MKKLINIGLLFVLLLSALIPISPALASNTTLAEYLGTVRITNNSTSSATNVFTVFNLTTQDLIDGDFAFQNLTNTSMQTNGGADTEYMPAPGALTAWAVYVPSIIAKGTLDYKLYVGGNQNMDGEIRYFSHPVTGMTTLDDAALEPGANNFTIEQIGFFNTTVGGFANAMLKEEALITTISDVDQITTGIYGTNTDFQNYGPLGANANSINAGNAGAQTFTVEQSHYIEFIDMYWSNVIGGDQGQITVSMRATAAGAPTGSDLTSITIETSTIAGGFHWDSYTLAEPLQLDAGTTYALVAQSLVADPLVNNIDWRADVAGTYTGGNAYYPIGNSQPAVDMSFREWGYVYAEAAGVTPGDYTVKTNWDFPFISLGIDVSSDSITPVSSDLVMNTPLWQSECNTSPFTTIDATGVAVTVSGAVWTLDEGYHFDSINDYLEVAHNANQLLATGGTIEAWVRPASYGEINLGVIVDKSTGISANDGYHLRLQGPGYDALDNTVQCKINDGTTITSAVGVITPGDGNWYHLVATWDGTGLVTIYVNGVQSGTPGISRDPAGITTANAMRIGNRSTATDRTFDGDVGEVRIYDDDLTVAQVLQNYNATREQFNTGDVYTRSNILATVQGNANDWDFLLNDSVPYLESQEIIISSTQQQLIEWENDDTTFTDGSGQGHDATPTFRSSSSDADVTAELISFVPVSAAVASNFTILIPGDMIGAVVAPSELFNETVGPIPGAPFVEDVMASAGIPAIMFYVPLLMLGICIVGLVVGKFSLLAQLIIMSIIIFASAGIGVPAWIGLIFLLDGLAFVLASKQFGW